MILLALLLSQISISHTEAISPDRVQSEVSFACGANDKVSFLYENDWKSGDRGNIASVKVNGAEVPGIAAFLSEQAQRRSIDQITITKCGEAEGVLRISAEMKLSQLESVREKLPPSILFKFNERGLIDDAR